MHVQFYKSAILRMVFCNSECLGFWRPISLRCAISRSLVELVWSSVRDPSLTVTPSVNQAAVSGVPFPPLSDCVSRLEHWMLLAFAPKASIHRLWSLQQTVIILELIFTPKRNALQRIPHRRTSMPNARSMVWRCKDRRELKVSFSGVNFFPLRGDSFWSVQT